VVTDDGGSGLSWRQFQLAQTASWTRPQPTDIVGDLHHAYRDGLEYSADFDERIDGALGSEMVTCFVQKKAGFLGDSLNSCCGKIAIGVDTGADGGAAQSQLTKPWQDLLQARYIELYLPRIPAELLSKPHSGGVLQVGSTDLQNVLKLTGLKCQLFVQLRQGGKQFAVDRFKSCQVNRGRDHVIAGLPPIHMVVRVYGFITALTAAKFNGPVGDHLVSIHVRRGARAGLEDVHYELGIQLALNHLLSRSLHSLADFRR